MNWLDLTLWPTFIFYSVIRFIAPKMKTSPGDLSDYFYDACKKTEEAKENLKPKELFFCIKNTNEYKNYMQEDSIISQEWVTVLIVLILFLSFNKLVLYLRVS